MCVVDETTFTRCPLFSSLSVHTKTLVYSYWRGGRGRSSAIIGVYAAGEESSGDTKPEPLGVRVAEEDNFRGCGIELTDDVAVAVAAAVAAIVVTPGSDCDDDDGDDDSIDDCGR